MCTSTPSLSALLWEKYYKSMRDSVWHYIYGEDLKNVLFS